MPLRRFLGGVFRTALAFFGLMGLNWAGIGVGINLINAAMIGFLGIPGICCALTLNFIL